MAQIKDLKRFDRLALKILGFSSINTAVGTDLLPGLMQYWTSQSNIAVVFSTIFATVGVTFLVEFEGKEKWIALLPLVLFLYFAFRTWAFGRCAKLVARIWL